MAIIDPFTGSQYVQYWPENLNLTRNIFCHAFLKQPVFFGQLFLLFKGTCLPFGGLGIFESWLQLMITSSGII